MKTPVILLMMAASIAHAAWQDHKEVRDLRLDARGLDELVIDAGAGRLVVVGVDDADSILATATIVVPDADDDDARRLIEQSLRLTLQREGAAAVLTSHFESGGWHFRESPRIDLEVRVPKSMALAIDDGSGALEVTGVRGDVRIEDGSGRITLHEVGGSVAVEDGSGAIEIRGVGGDLRIVDGSGSIDVSGVAGSVTLDDGSGSVTIRDVQHDLLILDDGSGTIRHSGVRGRVEDRSRS